MTIEELAEDFSLSVEDVTTILNLLDTTNGYSLIYNFLEGNIDLEENNNE